MIQGWGPPVWTWPDMPPRPVHRTQHTTGGNDSRTRPALRAALAIAVGTLIGAAGGAARITGQPSSVETVRSEVERLKAQLDAADVEAEKATEAFNGARWRREQAEGRIRANGELLASSEKRLAGAREARMMAGGPVDHVHYAITRASFAAGPLA